MLHNMYLFLHNNNSSFNLQRQITKQQKHFFAFCIHTIAKHGHQVCYTLGVPSNRSIHLGQINCMLHTADIQSGRFVFNINWRTEHGPYAMYKNEAHMLSVITILQCALFLFCCGAPHLYCISLVLKSCY